jgi:type I restriction enzyme, S subunit
MNSTNKTIDEISDNIRYGYTGKAKDAGNAVYIRITDIDPTGKFKNNFVFIDVSENDLEKFRLNHNDILVARSGATAGKVAIYDLNETAVFASYLIRIQPSKDIIPKYLFYFCHSSLYWDQLNTIKVGGAQPNVNATNLKKIKLLVPPLSEQQRIVSKLDKLFEKIDKAIALHQKNMDEADVFMGSVLNDVFGELEEKYEKVSLDTISDLIDGDRGKNYPKKSDFLENGYCLFLNAKNVTKFGFKFDEKMFISKEKDELLRKGKLKKEDVIITTRGTIGNVSIYDKSVPYDNVRINSGMAIIRIKDMDKLYNRFIYKYLYSPQFLGYLSEVQSGSAQPQITIKNLKESYFSIPPLPIQQKVVTYLDNISEKIEKVKSVQKEKLESLKALKASILDEAFRGEL